MSSPCTNFGGGNLWARKQTTTRHNTHTGTTHSTALLGERHGLYGNDSCFLFLLLFLFPCLFFYTLLLLIGARGGRGIWTALFLLPLWQMWHLGLEELAASYQEEEVFFLLFLPFHFSLLSAIIALFVCYTCLPLLCGLLFPSVSSSTTGWSSFFSSILLCHQPESGERCFIVFFLNACHKKLCVVSFMSLFGGLSFLIMKARLDEIRENFTHDEECRGQQASNRSRCKRAKAEQ